MNYKELVREAIKLLDVFDPGKQCVDTFIEDSARTLLNRPFAEQIFITDTVYGCLMHQKLLDTVINSFYNEKGNNFLKADRNQFVVVSYLAIFHLDDLGREHFSAIIKSLDSLKMYNFLRFFFNVCNLITWIRSEWSQLYDATYVNNKWIVPLLRWQTELDGLLQYLEKKTTKGIQLTKFPKKTTTPREFDLTKPKMRSLLAPEMIPLQEKHKPVPASTHRAPKEQEVLENIKQKNHLKAQMVLYEANTRPFRCANPQKSEKTKNIMSEIQQNLESTLKFDAVYSSGTPATQKTNALPVKLNATAILREAELYNRQRKEESNRLECLMQGASEPSEFMQWQKEMKEKDLQNELVQLQRRRLQAKITRAEALLAREQVIELNQHKALLKKEETSQVTRRCAEMRLQEEKAMKELVQLVVDGHKNSKAAKVKAQEIKKCIVKEVSKQNQELLQQAQEEFRAELCRKFELIRQIRALGSVPHLSHKFLDDTETAGHELLCEMSLAELRERLARAKEEEQREQEKKRQRVQEEKPIRGQLLLEQLDTIAACKTVARCSMAQKKQKMQQQRQKLQEAVSTDEGVVALKKTLEMKKQEAQQRKEREKAKSKLDEQMAAQNVKSYSYTKQVLEKQHWLQMEQALEKQVQHEMARRNSL